MELNQLDQFPLKVVFYVILAVVFMYLVSGFVKPILASISQIWFAFIMNFMRSTYNAAVHEDKRELFSFLSDEKWEDVTLLEIGSGPGGNLEFYPTEKNIKLIAVEPNTHCQKYLQRNLENYDNISLHKYVVNFAEDMKEIESNSLELVVSTIVLCSVADISKVLSEIKRVLKPGGRFVFMEHVAGEPGTWMPTIQSLANGLWGVLFDGCNVTRNTSLLIDNAGFATVNYKRFNAKLSILFKPVHPHIKGYAIK